MKLLRGIGWILIIAFIWLVLSLLTREFAHHYLGFLAAYITDSCAASSGDSCRLFEWDKNLQSTAYWSYAVAFSLLTVSTAVVLNKQKIPMALKKLAVITFVLAFPTYTHWGVASNCRGFGGCTSGYTTEVVVPLIMTFNVYTALNILLALSLIWFYMRVNPLKFLRAAKH